MPIPGRRCQIRLAFWHVPFRNSGNPTTFDAGLRDSSRESNVFTAAITKTNDSLEECADSCALAFGVWGLRSKVWGRGLWSAVWGLRSSFWAAAIPPRGGLLRSGTPARLPLRGYTPARRPLRGKLLSEALARRHPRAAVYARTHPRAEVGARTHPRAEACIRGLPAR